jgi:hypothetical protein
MINKRTLRVTGQLLSVPAQLPRQTLGRSCVTPFPFPTSAHTCVWRPPLPPSTGQPAGRLVQQMLVHAEKVFFWWTTGCTPP